MININKLRKVYSDHNVALKDISAEMSSKITTIIGRNGAGKTTLLRILSTQLMPTSGKATIFGLDVVHDAREVRKRIVSIPQEASPMGILTPFEQVSMYLVGRGFSRNDARKAALDALDAVGLHNARNNPADTLSGGMKRKCFVAMALAANSDVVFLDEPTTGLDPISRLEVWSAIKKLAGNVVLTTHYMEEAETLSKEVFLVESGEIIDRGTVKSLLKEFGDKVRVESYKKMDNAFRVGTVYIKYVPKEQAPEFLSEGDNIRKISLDDLFIMRGVAIES
ncbi:MAG: ATP-binding cassette domain-containing protein [Thermoplasmataceae archaeon]